MARAEGISVEMVIVDDDVARKGAVQAPTWPNVLKQRPGRPEAQIAAKDSAKASSPTGNGAQSEAGRKAKLAIDAACRALIDAEGELTEMDRVTGDGDLGTSMERAAKAVQGAVGSYPERFGPSRESGC